MPIRYDTRLAELEGDVAVESAEELSEWLATNPHSALRLEHCGHLHAAVLQVLLARRPRIETPPPDPWLAAVLAAALAPTDNQDNR